MIPFCTTTHSDPPATRPATNNPVKSETFIVSAADQCVKCGLCLPHCPTYRLLRNEADSPRGRIALMQGLAQGQLKADTQLLTHLDRCLGCLACEKVCPSKVHYGQLLDSSRDWIETQQRRPRLKQWLRQAGLYLASKPGVWRRSWGLLKLYQRSGLQTLLRISGLLRLTKLHYLDAQLPEIKTIKKISVQQSVTMPQPTNIGLFSGCMEGIVSSTLHQDIVQLLNRIGYEVLIPSTQGCCGALHQHNGALATARTLAQININAFNRHNLETVLYLSSGCGATLQEYSGLLDNDPPNPKGLPAFIEAMTFLANHAQLEQLVFKPLPATIACLSPCSQRYATGGDQALDPLLGLIPDINIIRLNNHCCGAAGSYMLTQPDIATRLRDEILDTLGENTPRYLLSANVGCSIHLTSGLRQRGLDIEVIHPLTLLARQLANDQDY